MVKTRNARRCVMMYCSLGKTPTQEPTVIDPLTRLKMTLPWPTRHWFRIAPARRVKIIIR